MVVQRDYRAGLASVLASEYPREISPSRPDTLGSLHHPDTDRRPVLARARHRLQRQEKPSPLYTVGHLERRLLSTLADRDRLVTRDREYRLVRLPRLDRTRLQNPQTGRLAVAIYPDARSRPRRTVVVSIGASDLVVARCRWRHGRGRGRGPGRADGNVANGPSHRPLAGSPQPADQRLSPRLVPHSRRLAHPIAAPVWTRPTRTLGCSSTVDRSSWLCLSCPSFKKPTPVRRTSIGKPIHYF